MTRPRNRVLQFLLDIVLIPIAVLIVVIEDVLWAGALTLLRRMTDLAAVRAMRVHLERLPAHIALPLFLVPETLSHIAGAYATFLLAQGRLVSAILFGVLVKGICTLLLVWIYQCCEETLMRVPWFVRLHDWALRVRDWAKAQVGPMRARARALMAPPAALVHEWLAPFRGADMARKLDLRLRFLAWRARFSGWVAGFRQR